MCKRYDAHKTHIEGEENLHHRPHDHQYVADNHHDEPEVEQWQQMVELQFTFELSDEEGFHHFGKVC